MSEFPTPANKVRSKLTDQALSRALRATLLRKDSREAKVTLVWLAMMTRATESTFDSDPLIMAGKSMQREVWLEIQNRLRLSEQDVRDLHELVASWGE